MKIIQVSYDCHIPVQELWVICDFLSQAWVIAPQGTVTIAQKKSLIIPKSPKYNCIDEVVVQEIEITLDVSNR